MIKSFNVSMFQCSSVPAIIHNLQILPAFYFVLVSCSSYYIYINPIYLKGLTPHASRLFLFLSSLLIYSLFSYLLPVIP